MDPLEECKHTYINDINQNHPKINGCGFDGLPIKHIPSSHTPRKSKKEKLPPTTHGSEASSAASADDKKKTKKATDRCPGQHAHAATSRVAPTHPRPYCPMDPHTEPENVSRETICIICIIYICRCQGRVQSHPLRRYVDPWGLMMIDRIDCLVIQL